MPNPPVVGQAVHGTFGRKSTQNSSLGIFGNMGSASTCYRQNFQGDIFSRCAAVALLALFSFLMTSCDIFRKSNSSYTYHSGRDSTEQTLSQVDLTRVIWYDGSEVLMDFDASGFRVIRIHADGSVETEGEGGQLSLRKAENKNSGGAATDSLAKNEKLVNVRDSVEVEAHKEKVYHADPDTWFNWWWVFAGGAVLLIGLVMTLRKLNVKSLLKW